MNRRWIERASCSTEGMCTAWDAAGWDDGSTDAKVDVASVPGAELPLMNKDIERSLVYGNYECDYAVGNVKGLNVGALIKNRQREARCYKEILL